MKDKRPQRIVITDAAHKRLKLHCARTGEHMCVAATRAVVEYLRRARK